MLGGFGFLQSGISGLQSLGIVSGIQRLVDEVHLGMTHRVASEATSIEECELDAQKRA